MKQQEIWIRSTADESLQPSLFYRASMPGRPLLVGLHTWSWDRFNQIDNMLPLAEKQDFNLLLPEFRGSNRMTNPHCTLACGSETARQDIKDAIDHVVAQEAVDGENIFLLGLSGGGHMALLTAAMWPEMFKAVGAYVPITDLELWITQNQEYADHVLACCSHDSLEMRSRSPMTYAASIARANVKLFHGRHDPVVPMGHSLMLYNRILEIAPQARVFLDIFDGGHEIDMAQAEYWILSQYRPKAITKVTG